MSLANCQISEAAVAVSVQCGGFLSCTDFQFASRRVYPIFSAPKIMADDKKHTYDESKVKTLSSIEHIRL